MDEAVGGNLVPSLTLNSRLLSHQAGRLFRNSLFQEFILDIPSSVRALPPCIPLKQRQEWVGGWVGEEVMCPGKLP